MKRQVRQIIVVGLLVVLSTAILSWPALLRYLIQSGLQGARRGGQHLSWSGLSTGIRSASFDSLTVWVPSPKIQGALRIPISIELQDTTVALNVAKLLTLTPSVAFQTSLYGGSVRGNADIARESGEISAKIEGVEIGRHPQMAALGVRGGAITAVIDGLVVSPSGPTSGTFSLSVRQLTPPAIGAAKTLLKIEDLGPFNLNTAGSITPQGIEISTIKFDSQFGAASGQLTARNHLSGSPTVGGDIRVTLTDQGVSTLGPWLPLISGSGLNSAAREFSVRVATLSCARTRGDAVFLNLGDQCAKLSFTPG